MLFCIPNNTGSRARLTKVNFHPNLLGFIFSFLSLLSLKTELVLFLIYPDVTHREYKWNRTDRDLYTLRVQLDVAVEASHAGDVSRLASLEMD